MANLLLKDQILVLSRQTATRAAVDFINIPSNRAATLQPEVVLFYFRKERYSIQHTPVGHCDKYNIYAQHMDGYIFTRICIGMLLKPYMKILKLYYMVLHFCRFLDGNCIFISVPYIYSHLF